MLQSLREEKEGKLQMGLTSLFEEVRAFKVRANPFCGDDFSRTRCRLSAFLVHHSTSESDISTEDRAKPQTSPRTSQKPAALRRTWLVALHLCSLKKRKCWKAFQAEFGAHRGLARVLKSPLTPQNCSRNKQKILEKGTLFSTPNPGMHQTLVQKISECASHVPLRLLGSDVDYR